MHLLPRPEAEQVTEVQSGTYVLARLRGPPGKHEVIASSTEEISTAEVASCSGRRLHASPGRCLITPHLRCCC